MNEKNNGGWLKVVGLGPGAEALITPEVSAALAEATDNFLDAAPASKKSPGLLRSVARTCAPLLVPAKEGRLQQQSQAGMGERTGSDK